MEINFFTIWFIVSPFIILHLCHKNRDYRDKANSVIDQINNNWDKEFRMIIQRYGSVEQFLSDHKDDFNILRNYILNVYLNFSSINRSYMTDTDRLVEKIDQLSDSELKDYILGIKKRVCIATDTLLENMNSFVTDETEAHNSDQFDNIVEKLNEIDKTYNNNSILEELSNIDND